MVDSREKGKRGERDIAAQASEWWRRLPQELQLTADGKPTVFASTPGSGGWGNSSVKAGFRVAGDIMSTSQSWPFTAEVKRREAWTLGNLTDARRKSPVWGWWLQTVTAAKKEGGIPIMFFRKNRHPWICMLPVAVAVPRLGLVTSDICWHEYPPNNLSGVHSICYFAHKLFASDPALWLDVPRVIEPPKARGRRRHVAAL